MSTSERPTFEDVFGRPPSVSAQAPGRVNLLGEHTDYNEGFVLPTTTPQQTLVEMAPTDTRPQVYSANFARSVSLGEGQDFGRYVDACIAVLQEDGSSPPPVEVLISSNVPIGAGLSSSAALEVALLRAFDCLLGSTRDPAQLALMAQRAEAEYVGVHCGIMDQMTVSLGEPGRLLFLDTRTLGYRLVNFPGHSEILVVHSGESRELAASPYNERREECLAAAKALGVTALRDVDVLPEGRLSSPLLYRRARHVVSENARVLAACHESDPKRFGTLMRQSHASLRDDFDVSTETLDDLVAYLDQQPEVFGARMTGAGFGGACVALVAGGTAALVASRATRRGFTVLIPQL